jgi:hypothetical protein
MGAFFVGRKEIAWTGLSGRNEPVTHKPKQVQLVPNHFDLGIIYVFQPTERVEPSASRLTFSLIDYEGARQRSSMRLISVSFDSS